jgi:hypothetical protein
LSLALSKTGSYLTLLPITITNLVFLGNLLASVMHLSGPFHQQYYTGQIKTVFCILKSFLLLLGTGLVDFAGIARKRKKKEV